MLGMSVSGAEPRLALALLCAVVLAHAHDKRAESESAIVSPVPFTFAARYGRSPQRFITPRNDRWMMTTRYGKRSESFTMEEDSVSHEGPQGERGARLRPPAPPRAIVEGGGGGALTLSCEYTGVLELYRCTHARTHPLTQLARRSDDALAPSQQQ